MKKLILLAAVAAIVPTAAIAQRDNHARQNRAQVSQDRHADRANRQTVRSDRRTDRANRQTVRSDRRTVQANRQLVRSDRRVARQDRRQVRNRSAYVAPVRNWNYRRVSVGYRLQPAFYGSRYYITDYGAYHLQVPHHRWLRWIRYGDDLLLVNIRTGRVLDVVHYRGW
jgi:Ni/Co efflux regulator RcnB